MLPPKLQRRLQVTAAIVRFLNFHFSRRSAVASDSWRVTYWPSSTNWFVHSLPACLVFHCIAARLIWLVSCAFLLLFLLLLWLLFFFFVFSSVSHTHQRYNATRYCASTTMLTPNFRASQSADLLLAQSSTPTPSHHTILLFLSAIYLYCFDCNFCWRRCVCCNSCRFLSSAPAVQRSFFLSHQSASLQQSLRSVRWPVSRQNIHATFSYLLLCDSGLDKLQHLP